MQSDNPYAPPQAEVRDTPPVVQVPDDICKKIKSAWVAALVSAGVTLIFSVFGIQGFELLNLIDVALMLGLAYGIYRKSRAAAIAMLVYFVGSKIIIMVESGRASGLITGLIFLYFYWQGVVGTIGYHRTLKLSKQHPTPPTAG